MRKPLIAVAAVAIVFGIAGCSSESAPAGSTEGQSQQEAAAPADLTGDWTEENGQEEHQTATISGDTMEIYWVSDGGDTKSLYWAGTFVPPTEPGDYTWTSENDTSKTDSALLASTAESKEFTFSGDEISYEVTALGTTKTVRLTR